MRRPRIAFFPSQPNQAGQATVEAVIAMTVLSLLFVLVPLMGKYQDIAHRASMASRYVAWQSTVRNDSDGGSFENIASTTSEVHQKFFSGGLTPVRTLQATPGTPVVRVPLWSDHAGRGLVSRNEDIRVGYGTAMASDPVQAFQQGRGTGDPFKVLQPEHFKLQNRGLLKGAVEVRIANIPDQWLGPFNGLNLVIRREVTVMPDNWAASSGASVDSRVGNSGTVFPASRVQWLSTLIDLPVLALEDGSMRAPKIGRLDFWRDAVPQDRLR